VPEGVEALLLEDDMAAILLTFLKHVEMVISNIRV
jgi:hypothetical protein